MLRLYGNIGSWNRNSAEEFISRLQSASAGKERVSLHIHSCGGNVIEGNMIFNAIKNNGCPVDAYVDGLAASQAAIILMAADKVYISENGFIMIHAPHSCVSGTADDIEKEANSLREMKKNFIKVLMSKTGKAEEHVTKWMQGDNWFSADQALAEGLVDGIVDKVVIPDIAESESDMNEDVFYAKFNALLNNNQMNKKEIIEKFGLANVTEQSPDADIYGALEKQLSDEKQARLAAEAKLKSEEKSRCAALIATIASKITVDQKAKLEDIGDKMGYDALKCACAGYEQKTSLSAMINNGSQGGQSPTGQASWDFDEWMKNDPSGLEKLATSDYEQFNAIYKKKFGADAPK